MLIFPLSTVHYFFLNSFLYRDYHDSIQQGLNPLVKLQLSQIFSCSVESIWRVFEIVTQLFWKSSKMSPYSFGSTWLSSEHAPVCLHQNGSIGSTHKNNPPSNKVVIQAYTQKQVNPVNLTSLFLFIFK